MTKVGNNDQSSDLAPEVHLPGLYTLREVVAKYGRHLMPSGKTFRKDSVAGLTVAVSGVPEGLAGGVLAGTNPIFGLYANIIGAIVGGIFSSTQLMVIQNTSAVSLVAGQSLLQFSPQERDNALFLMVGLAGLFAIAFGFLGFGRLTRFVSYSVMTGFITGIALVLIFSQLPTLTGLQVQGSNRLLQLLDLFRQLRSLDLTSLLVGLSTFGVAILIGRTRLSSLAGLLGILIPSLLVAVFHLDTVALVRDVSSIPKGIPLPRLPSLAVSMDVFTGALAVVVIALVQGAGVSQTVPNPDGSRRRASRDFIAQGLGNVASALFRGLPVGGSVSSTALNVMAGARHRWSTILSGVWTGVIVFGAPGLIGYVAMPALGAVIILAASGSVKRSDLLTVWQAGWPARVAALLTFGGMLLLPVQLAVGLGVVVSTLLYVSEASSDVSLRELKERPDGQIEEHPPPRRLPDNSVTVLDVYGHVFFAGARTLQRLLPSPEGAEHPIVILRLRGRSSLGATMVEVLSRYAAKLQEAGGRLYLTGLSHRAHEDLKHLRQLHVTGPIRIFEATAIRGQSTRAAHDEAEGWLLAQNGEDTDARREEGGTRV